LVAWDGIEPPTRGFSEQRQGTPFDSIPRHPREYWTKLSSAETIETHRDASPTKERAQKGHSWLRAASAVERDLSHLPESHRRAGEHLPAAWLLAPIAGQLLDAWTTQKHLDRFGREVSWPRGELDPLLRPSAHRPSYRLTLGMNGTATIETRGGLVRRVTRGQAMVEHGIVEVRDETLRARITPEPSAPFALFYLGFTPEAVAPARDEATDRLRALGYVQ
jgi:hypothetical protein